MKKTVAKWNLRLVMGESALTKGLLCMSIMSLFYRSIGLNQAEIAAAQAIFTVILAGLNYPMGWLADRFSRKWANVIGDLGCALGFVLYSQVDSFAGVVFCESWLGIFVSLSQGVDYALLKQFTAEIDLRPAYFQRQSAQLALWQEGCSLLLMLLGGPLGAIDFRLAIGLSGVPYLLGGLLSLGLRNKPTETVKRDRPPQKSMRELLWMALHQPKLRRMILVQAVGTEMTHGIIWVVAPAMVLVGVPVALVSSMYILQSLAIMVGIRLALRYAARLKPWQLLGAPLLLMTISLGTMGVHLSLVTIWLYLLMGVAQGWVRSTLLPLVQEQAAEADQTAIVSLAKVAGQALYVPVVWLIGLAADVELRYAFLTSMGIFVLLSVILVVKLYRQD